MKQINALLCCLVLLGAGCLTPQKVVLLDLDTDRSVTFSSDTPYWDAIVPTPVNGQYVYHMYRQDDGLRLVKRDLAGNVLKEVPLPLFYPYYTSAHVALRPDESGIAYHKYETEDLYYFDFDKGRERVLCRNFASTEIAVEALAWINNRELVSVLNYDTKLGHAAARVVKIDSDSGKIAAESIFSDGLPRDVSISPTGRFLAVAPNSCVRGIYIIDLTTLKIVLEMPFSAKPEEVQGTAKSRVKCNHMESPAWLPDETELAYIEGKTLSVFSLTDNSIKPIIEIPKDHVCYFVGYPRKNLLLVRSGTSGGNSKLKMIDPFSGRIVKIISEPFNGKMMLVSDGKVLAHIIGY